MHAHAARQIAGCFYNGFVPRHEITITRLLSARHAIQIYDGSVEPLHGHKWIVEVTVGAVRLDKLGMVMDFHELERIVDDVLSAFNGRILNDVAPFAGEAGGGRRSRSKKPGWNPTAENFAVWLGRAIEKNLHRAPGMAPVSGTSRGKIAGRRHGAAAKLIAVRVTESPGCRAAYRNV